MKSIINLMLLCWLVFLMGSCKKDFLEAKPSSGILTPTTLNELQGLLEHGDLLNRATPALSHMAADDYIFVDDQSWQSAQTATERNSYIWRSDIYEGATVVSDWSEGYASIFYCNNVLAALQQISRTDANAKQYRMVKGWALFMRAYCLYDLARNFCAAYDESSAVTDLGMPIRTSPAIDQIVPRSSLKDTYTQILKDLNEAAVLLDPDKPLKNNRPGRAAAYALFARIYLSMRKYEDAGRYADSTLAINSKLIDYNTVSQTATSPFAIDNDESIFSTCSIFFGYSTTSPLSSNTRVTINPELINLYDSKDLRLNVFFRRNTTTGNLYMRRGYYFQSVPYTGLATDEMYLIKSECLARRNDVAGALIWLNELLKKRFAPADFRSITTNNQVETLNRILLERRKELVWRTLRWSDLKRLNKEGANITLSRTINGETYTLPPNDRKYVFPIPDDEIVLSGIQQNPR